MDAFFLWCLSCTIKLAVRSEIFKINLVLASSSDILYYTHH